ncbi:MAG: PAS domain S-box protein [Kiritimatiellae bacterium]|nr:PAS domain S-box protein [Kiritimatiellia bacterium]
MVRKRKKAAVFLDDEELAGSPVLFFEADAGGRLKYGAKQIAATLGLDPGAVENRSLLDLVVEEQQALAKSTWERLGAGEPIRGKELSLRNAKGESQPFSVSLFAVKDRQGRMVGVRGIAGDLAAQKGLAHALEAAEERFSVLFRESSDPILILSMTGEILSANPSFERIAGVESEALFRGDRGWDDFVYAEDMPLLRAAIRRCAETRRDEAIEFRMRNAQGFFIWFEQSHSILHDENGRPRGIMAVARDITQRKEREIKLREEAQALHVRHERAQELITKLTLFITRITALPPGIDSFLSGVCDVLFDMYRPLLVLISIPGLKRTVFQAGRHLPDGVLDGRGELRHCAMCADVEKQGAPLYLTLLQEHPQYGRDPFVRELALQTYLGAPLRDSTGTLRGSLGLLDTQNRDFDHLDIELLTVASLQVASRLRADEQDRNKRELEDHLRQAQKMEAVGMLAGGIAHDFNNVLSGIMGFASYLLSKADPGSELHRHLGLIEKSAIQASELTRRLLSFSRRTHFAKEAVNLNEVAQEILGILRHSLAREVTIEEHLEEGLGAVHGDRSQMAQVLMNLCINAAEAMGGKGGTLTVTTQCRALTPRERGMLIDPRDEDYVCLTVADTGKGMDPEVQEHIFDPFFTTKSKAGGTGLGLSIVYGIISNHGGEIRVESTEGVGSAFRVYLPVHRGKERPKPATSRAQLEGTETVLVVEDEQIVRQMVAEILKDHGYQALCASSGEEAVKIILKHRDKVDLVLLDMIMPGMDGEQTFCAIREVDKKVPILLTSGFAQGERCARLISDGAKGLVRKPYKSHSLLGHVRAALGDEQGDGAATDGEGGARS